MTKDETNQRNYSIDFLKGLLIMLVIIGHIIPGPVREIFIRYIVYSFHMPIFIAISGFLLPMDKLKSLSFISLVKKYLSHIVIPWIISVNIYHFVINRPPENLSNLPEFINIYLYPFYHLWFVLGFLFYVFMTWVFLKAGIKVPLIFTLALIISIFSRFLDHNPVNTTTTIFQYMEYDLRLQNYIFFILGMIIRKYLNKQSHSTKSLLKISGYFSLGTFLIIIALFFCNFPSMEKLMFFVFNFPLAIFSLLLCIYNYFPRNKFLEFAGRNSFALYLWHILIKELAMSICYRENLFLYYILNLIFFIGGVILIKSLNNIKLFRKYFFGNK